MTLSELPILSMLIVTPLFGVVILLLARGRGEVFDRNVYQLALWVSATEAFLVLIVLWQFDASQFGLQWQESVAWHAPFGLTYRLAVDGISLPIILLTALIIPLCFIYRYRSLRDVHSYAICLLLLQSFVMGALTAMDIVLFYIFFEASLIPLFLIIGIWGGEQRLYATFKFFLYTFAGSLFMLVAIAFMVVHAETTQWDELRDHSFPFLTQQWLWLAFFASFAVKTPMFPFHTWLPAAHVEAPATGSVILAAVLLKLGIYGFMRFSVPLFPEASVFFAPFVLALSVIAIIYGSLVAWAQEDIKKVIAYSSVAHMGYVTLGLFSIHINGAQGAMVQVISHGLISAALFFLVGMMYERTHRRDIAFYGGVASVMPRAAFFFMFFTLASIALPGTSGFVGEFLTLLSAWQVHPLWAVGASAGVILAPLYMLSLYRRVFFGAVKKSIVPLTDLSSRETIILIPLLVAVVALGMFPSPWMNVSQASLSVLWGAGAP